MTKFWQGGIQGSINLNLAGGVIQMIVSSYDVSDSHRRIIDHHRKIISGEPITPEDDEVIQLGIVKFHPSLNEILYHSGSFIRGEKSDRKGSFRIRRTSVKTGPIVFGFDPGFESGFPFFLQLFRSTITSVRLSFFQESLRCLLIEGHPLG